MPEMNFDAPEEEEAEVPQGEEVEPEAEPEPEAEAEEAPDRLGQLENAVSQLVDYVRSKEEGAQGGEAEYQPRQPALSKIPKPDFGGNTVASALWDRIEAMEERALKPWQELQETKQKNAAIEAEFARLTDQATTYISSRVSQGDPKVGEEDVMKVLAKMGMLRDRRIPYNEALELAYNAVAYRSAKERATAQGRNEGRGTTARVPAPYRPSTGTRTVAQRQPAQAVPNTQESRTARLKREFETLERQLAGKSPEELEDSLGFNQ